MSRRGLGDHAGAAGARGSVVGVAGAARRAGVRAGDRIRAVDGRRFLDVLDLEALSEERFTLRMERGGRLIDVLVSPQTGEWHGIELEDGLGDAVRRCVNQCPFCFVDQMPAGLRASLYIKDDDYRLSFLQGSFVTLTNLAERDLRRIEGLRLSPLFVSLHAWDDEVRARLMGPRAKRSRERLLRLAAAGVRTHIQVVLCPGVNDGAVLEETVTELARVTGVEDVAVVPVSLAREGVLRRVSRDDSAAVVECVEGMQRRLLRKTGRRFVHAADELYLSCGRLPPQADAEQQYENGIGVCACAEREAEELQHRAGVSVALLTGTLALPVVERICGVLGRARPFIVRNRLFGDHVTVTGLLGGREVLSSLRERPLGRGEWLLVPAAFLPAHLGRTLDDVSAGELADACDGRLVVGDGIADAFARLPAR